MGIPIAEKKTWTILDLITWGTEYLTEKNIEEARLNIELLLAHVLQFNRIQLYTNFDKPLSDDELALFKSLLKRRLSREPLQYILGETEFMGLKFSVDKRVLIPRPDTEILVEAVIEKIKNNFINETAIQILEIGTGTGCIAISLAKMIPTASITSIDISEDALNVASANAKVNGVTERVAFIRKDFLIDNNFAYKFHCIVSNPPYISNDEYVLLDTEVREFEPKTALADGKDGLTFYRSMANRCGLNLFEKGFIAVEHAYNQSDDVQKIFSQNKWKNLQTVKDYNGIDRCVIAE